METLKIKNQWPDVKKKILDIYPRLTENDLPYREGKEEQLLDTLQQKTGKKKDELVTWLNQLAEETTQRQRSSGGSSFGNKGSGFTDKSTNKSPGDKSSRGGL